MTGLDTNVLIRYLLADDPRLSPRARERILSECQENQPGFVNRIVLCELVWVLKRGYGFPRETISDLIEMLLSSSELAIENRDEVWQALRIYRSGGIEFVDCLIGSTNLALGCGTTLTFDKIAARTDSFTLLE